MAKVADKKPLKRGQTKFQLIGKAKIGDFTFKINEESQKSDWVYNALNLGIDCGNGNVVYADMMGGYGSDRDNVLYVHGTKKNDTGKDVDDFDNQFKVDWDDRLDTDATESIGDKCFITVGLEKDTKGNTFSKKFLSAYDAIEYIKDNLSEGTIINVKGDLKYSIYNDTIQTKKEIRSIFLSKKEDVADHKANFVQSILLDKDSIGKLDREKAVYPISARVIDYTKNYNDVEVKCNVPFMKTFELEVDKAKPENTKKFMDKILKVKKDITELIVEGDIVEGQNIVNITEDDIPDDIKELIEIGVYTMEEAIKACAVGGTREKRFIIRKPSIKMVGDEDNRHPVIQKFEAQYKDDDLVLDCMKEVEKEDEPETTDDSDVPFDTTNTNSDSETEADADENAWLKTLGEED